MFSLKRCGTEELVELETLWVTTPQSLKTNTWRAEVGEGAEGHYSHLEAACACGREEPKELETAESHESREYKDHALEHLLDFRLAVNSASGVELVWCGRHMIQNQTTWLSRQVGFGGHTVKLT